MKKFVVQSQVTIEAPKLDVWQALTNPDLTERYFFGCRVYSNWLVDGTITFSRRILWIFPFQLNGRILKITPGSWLEYSLKNSKSTSESIVTISLKDDAGKTLVRVTDDVGQGSGAEHRYDRSVKGWNKILKGLKRVVENENNK